MNNSDKIYKFIKEEDIISALIRNNGKEISVLLFVKMNKIDTEKVFIFESLYTINKVFKKVIRISKLDKKVLVPYRVKKRKNENYENIDNHEFYKDYIENIKEKDSKEFFQDLGRKKGKIIL